MEWFFTWSNRSYPSISVHIIPFPDTHDHSMNLKLFAAPFLVIGGTAAIYRFAVKYLRGSPRKLVFGSLFFLITALPVLQIVRFGGAIVAERYTYIPMIGIYFVFAEMYEYLLKGKFGNRNAVKGILLAGVGIPLLIFSCMTRERCGVWNNSLSLWNDVVGKFPCAVAYNNRGLACKTGGDNDRAIQDYTQAIMLNPNYAVAYDNRGLAYKSEGDYDRAIHDYTQAIMLNPGYAMAYGNRGAAYHAKGDYDRAILDYTQAITLDPGYAMAYGNRGAAYYAKGAYDRAIKTIRKRSCSIPAMRRRIITAGLPAMPKATTGMSGTTSKKHVIWGLLLLVNCWREIDRSCRGFSLHSFANVPPR